MVAKCALCAIRHICSTRRVSCMAILHAEEQPPADTLLLEDGERMKWYWDGALLGWEWGIRECIRPRRGGISTEGISHPPF